MRSRVSRSAAAGRFATLSTLCALLALPAAADRVRVEIEGIDGEARRNARAHLALAQEPAATLDEGRIRRLHAGAPDQIRRALAPFGYYRVSVVTELTREGDRWVATYAVDPGPRISLATVDVRVEGPGESEPAFRRVLQEMDLRPGAPLDHRKFDVLASALADRAATHGYLDARFAARELRIDLERYVAEAVLHFDTGPRYRFGEARFEQEVLAPEILEGYVTFEPGDPFDLLKLLRLQDALSDSPYFQRVEVVPRHDQAEDLLVPIVALLTPAPRQRWVLGGGWGTDTGPRGSAAVELRRINRRGHRGEAELKGSKIERSFGGSYLIPGAYPRTDVWRFSLGYAEIAARTSDSRTGLISAGRSVSRGAWREGISLTLARERFTVGPDSGTSQLLTPEASWTRIRADDRLYPTHGSRLTFTLRAGHEDALSDSSFAWARAEGRWVRPLAGPVRLLLRGELGGVSTDEFRTLPASLRFFAGGDQSVRGYGFQELGPAAEDGQVIGGQALGTGTVELDALFFERWGRWGVAVFYDFGNALPSFRGDLMTAAGVGGRWLSPIGMIRLDAAWALDHEGTPLRIHISLGPDL